MAFYANRDPAPGASGIGVYTKITIEIISDGFGIDAAAVTISVNGVFAWTGDAAQTGFSVVKTTITDGFRYVIKPLSPLPGNTTIPMFLYAEDLDVPFNILNLSWDFETGPDPTVRLWAGGAPVFPGILFYSDDGGDTWTEVVGAPGYLEGLWGPTNAPKVYMNASGLGVYTWQDGSGWSVELADSSANGNFNWNTYMAQTWCADDDSIVCTTGLGSGSTPYNNDIRTRPGPPGTAWVTEYTTPGIWESVWDVHGSPDGSAIFAFYSDGVNYYILQRSGVGTWSVVHSFPVGNYLVKQIRVVSATEVRLFGYESTFSADVLKVWLWNGATLSEEYSYDLNTLTAGVQAWAGAWMSKDGQDGGIAIDTNGAPYGVYFRRTSGTWALDDGDIQTVRILVGSAGIQNAVDDRLLIARGTFMRRTGGVWVDYSEELIPGWGGLSGEIGYLIGWFPFVEVLDPPVVVPVDPLEGASDVSPGALISFRVEVSETLQEPWKIKINRGNGWELIFTYSAGSAVFEPDFDGPGSSVTPTSYGFYVVVEPVGPFVYRQVVEVGLAIRDISGRPAVVA